MLCFSRSLESVQSRVADLFCVNDYFFKSVKPLFYAQKWCRLKKDAYKLIAILDEIE